MSVQLEYLKSIPYFSELSSAELYAVEKFVFERTAKRGELILLEGEPAEALYFVVSGAVKCFKTSVEGKEQILNIVLPGDSFSDVSVFDGGPSPTSAQTMGPVTLYGIRKMDLGVILRYHPQVSLNVAKVLASRVRNSKPRLTQRDMAAIAGTAREIVGRSLKALEEEGTIRLDRHRIVITDREALKEMVEAAS